MSRASDTVTYSERITCKTEGQCKLCPGENLPFRNHVQQQLLDMIREQTAADPYQIGMITLDPVVGRGEVYGFWGAGQGATTRMVVPFQEVATQPCAAKTVQFTP